MNRPRVQGLVAAVLAVALLVGLTGPTSNAPPAASQTVAVVVRAPNVTQAAAAVRAAQGTIDRELSFIGGVAAQLTPAAVASLRADPALHVALDEPMRFTKKDRASAVSEAPSETDPHAPTTTAGQLAAMNLGERWSRGAGSGVGVALIDTGVTETPELEGRVVHGPDYSGEGDGVDRYGHGTFMAGLIAGDSSATTGEHDGVAPGAHIVSVKLAGRDGLTSLSKVLDAIGWVVVNQDTYGIRVLNLSLGVPTNRSPQADPLSAAVQAAWASGITVVAAAGNEGTGTVTSPGRDPWVITVGATETHSTPDPTDDTVPSWSGSGKVTRSHKAELVAPGVSVVSLRAPGSTIDQAYPGARVGDAHFRGSGTSMSTALVSGAAAALLEFRPYATPDDVKGALVSAGVELEGTTSRAIDLAAADAAEADPDWRQDHRLTIRPPDRAMRRGMPWSQANSPSVDETWARMGWADGAWSRMGWADAAFTRMGWARMGWAEANLARMGWADAHVTRMGWARMGWARMGWARMGWADRSSAADRSWTELGWETASWNGPPSP